MPASSEYVPVWRLRELVGIDAAEKLLIAYGGRKVWVPADPKDASPLTKLLGIHGARQLSGHFRSGEYNEIGCTIELPRGDHNHFAIVRRRLFSMIEEDASDAEIIRELGFCDRTIRRWRKRLGKSKGGVRGPQHPQLAAMVVNPLLSDQEIREATGVSLQTVAKWRRQLTGTPSLRERGRSKRADILRLLAGGMLTTRQICERLGVDSATVAYHRKKLRQRLA